MHYHNFLLSRSGLMPPCPGASSLFDINTKKEKDPGGEFGPYTSVQDLRWPKGWGSCFECRFLENQRRNLIQKKYGRNRGLPRTFRSLNCNFSFCMHFNLYQVNTKQHAPNWHEVFRVFNGRKSGWSKQTTWFHDTAFISVSHTYSTKAVVTTGVWFLYEVRLCIRDIRSRAHRLLEHSRYTEAGPE